MLERKTTIYTHPVGDKFLIYAPLKRIAFVGNEALVKAINNCFDSRNGSSFSTSEIIVSLQKTGIFEPDQLRFSSVECDQQFNPTLCILMPTTACNLACTYCYASYKGKKNSLLKWSVAKKAIDIAYQNAMNLKKGRFALSFHGGGEPTLNKELFFKAAEYAKKLDPDCPISVTTNALWDKTFRNRALDMLSEISISLDGNEITQNRQRPDKSGAGTFSRVMETIGELEKRNISFGIRMTVTKDSLTELSSNISFLCSHTKCNSIQVEAVYNQGLAVGAGLTIDDTDKFVETFMDVHHFAKERGKSVHYSSARPHLLTNTFCTATSNALIVTSDGELTACYEVFDHSHAFADDFIIGKIDEVEGVVLYPGRRESLLRKISTNREECKDCFCYYHCAGDCPPKAFMSLHNNDKFRCNVTKAITCELLLDKIIENDGFWQGNIQRNQQPDNQAKRIMSHKTNN
jgi:uncharacterized protein